MAKVDIQLDVFKNSKVIFLNCKKLLNVHNYHMYLNFKFHVISIYNAKVMSQKPPVQGQGDKK